MSENFWEDPTFTREQGNELSGVIFEPQDDEYYEPPLLRHRRSPERKHFYSWTVSNRHLLKRSEELLLAPLNYYQAMISQINTISNIDITPFADHPIEETTEDTPLSRLSNLSSSSYTSSGSVSSVNSVNNTCNSSCTSNPNFVNESTINYDNWPHYYYDQCSEYVNNENNHYCFYNNANCQSYNSLSFVDSSSSSISVNDMSIKTKRTNNIDARTHVVDSSAIIGQQNDKDILILIHGFGGGLGYWAQNWTFLSERYELYAIDLPCFGRSNRTKIHFRTHVQVINYLTRELFRWFNTLQFTRRVIVLGHSFGAYIAAHFTMRYGPTYVKILAMVEPWGINEISPTFVRNIPLHWKVLFRLIGSIGPLTLLRSAGPMGPQLLRHFRPDFKKSWQNYADGAGSKLIYDYIYQCNVCKKVCGDKLIKRCCNHYINAREPLCNLLPSKLTCDIGIVMLFGENSWIDCRQATSMASKMRKNGFCVIHKALCRAGHQVFTDNPQEFNKTIDKLLTRARRHLYRREENCQNLYYYSYEVS